MKSEGSVEIDRPIDDVFRLTKDHVPEWSLVVTKEEILEEKHGVGTTFRTVTEDHGKQMEFQGVVSHYDPPYASAVQLTGEHFDIEAAYRFEDLSGRTRVTQMSIVNGKGGFRFFFLIFGWFLKKSSCEATQRELNSLKRFCEEY